MYSIATHINKLKYIIKLIQNHHNMSYIPLPTPQIDQIASITFSPLDDQLLLSSFDGSVLLYRCQTPSGQIVPKLMSKFHADAAVTSSVFLPSRSTFVGLLDGTVRQIDFENMKLTSPIDGDPKTSTNDTSSISQALNYLAAVPGQDSLVVASNYAGNLKYLDVRTQRPVFQHKTSKIFALDTTARYVTLGQASQQVQIYDVRKWNLPCQTRTSGLKYQITALRNFPSGEGYVLSSLDGRVSVEYYDELPEVQQLKFAFKCHRHKDKLKGTDSVYPVTTLRFHSQTNTLFTGGADGHVCLWDWQRRKRTKQFVAVDGAISHMDINHDESMLVVGTTDDLYLRARDYNDDVDSKRSTVYLRRLEGKEWTKR